MNPAADSPARIVVEALALLGLTLGLVLGLGISTLWLVVPVFWLSLTKRSFDAYALGYGEPGSWRFHLLLAPTIFGAYAVGHVLFAQWVLGETFAPASPPALTAEIVTQVLLIGLPEEVFFRGYLQTQLDRLSQRRWQVLGVSVGVGLPLAAALFALCHVFGGGPARLITFFPGLWYGWLRARTGNVWVPALYHAASNVIMKIVLTSLIP